MKNCSTIFIGVQIQEVILTKEMLKKPICPEPGGAANRSIFLFPQAFENVIEDCESRLGKKFWHHCRVPYVVFVEICQQDIERILGEQAGVDSAGDETIPILGLLVLASLWVLSSGCTFEAEEELTALSECAHLKFFHEQFCMWGTKAAEEHICMPKTDEEIAHVLRWYEQRGFPGCVGSVDCVHLYGTGVPLVPSVHAKARDR